MRSDRAVVRAAERAPAWTRRVLMLLVIAGLALMGLACGGAAKPPPQSDGRGAMPGSADWLGLNYNSTAAPGGLRVFASRGVVYDRGGALEISGLLVNTGCADLRQEDASSRLAVTGADSRPSA